MTITAQPRVNPTNLRSLLRLPPSNGTEGDVLVNVTADGVDVNTLFAEVQQVLKATQKSPAAVTWLPELPDHQRTDVVPQSISDGSVRGSI